MSKNVIRKVSGILLQIVGAIILFSTAIVCMFALILGKQRVLEWTDYLMVGAAAIASSLIGFSCFRAGKYFQVVSADELLAEDKRPLILYLRSFEFDRSAAGNHKAPIAFHDPTLGFAWHTVTARTYEETLAKIFSEIGPCVAVGEPGRELPIEGFPRKELPMDTWQAEVIEFMKGAALVAICSGNTEGVLWELEQAKKNVPLPRLLIFITGNTSRAWWRRAEEIFGQELYRKFPIFDVREHPLYGLIFFDENGTPLAELILPFNKRVLKEKLSPAFAQIKALPPLQD